MTDEQWGMFDLVALPLDPLPVIAEFNNLIDVWKHTRGDALLPRWPDFSFDELMPWIGQLAVSEFDGKDELHFKLFGGTFVKLFDQELTGKPLCGSLLPEQREGSRTHFMKLISGPFIGHGKGKVPAIDRDHIDFNVIDLPLAENGRDVSHFLHGVFVQN
ncbi:MAG: PAS domain-containing protein [Rhodospirillaceae bacterium]|jgi:hypothetical protein|nr:PAS domain-containing protein [Rhodospirillaceae bacterium]